MADLLVLLRPAESLCNGAGYRGKVQALPKKKGRPQYHKASIWQGRQSRLCQKEKKTRKNRIFTRKKVSEQDHGEDRVSSTVKEGEFQGGKEGQAKRNSL